MRETFEGLARFGCLHGSPSAAAAEAEEEHVAAVAFLRRIGRKGTAESA